MNICEILAINLKYYRKKYNLSQEKFAELLGTTLPYLNLIENKKADVKSSTIDKFAQNINKYDSTAKGGVAFSIGKELGLPIAFVCDGEKYENIRPFSSEEYVDAFLGL